METSFKNLRVYMKKTPFQKSFLFSIYELKFDLYITEK